MSKHLLLPQALLDLTWLRVSACSESAVSQRSRNLNAFRNGAMKRHMSQAALAHAPRSLPTELDVMPVDNALYAHRKRKQNKAIAAGNVEALSDLERRVEALKSKVLVEETMMDISPYSEDQLLSIYEDILSPASEQQQSPARAQVPVEEQDRHAIQALCSRLFQPDGSSETPSIRRIVAQIESVMDKARAAMETQGQGSEMRKTQPQLAPVKLREFESLIRIAILENEPGTAERALRLMKRVGPTTISKEDISDKIINWYALRGDIENVMRLLKKYDKGTPTESQRHLHIKAYVNATPVQTFPETALSLLHDYESRGLPAPIKTYTMCIFSLFKVANATASAQAWDLFSHMRYVAHPDPDAKLYALMMRACAKAFPSSLAVNRSEPERALDLWTEMTVDKRIEPTVETYNSVISALASSGEREYVMEGFRIAKEMLDGWRDARGVPRFLPDEHTFVALLDGAKRIRDLARVRWILAEMVKETQERGLELKSDVMWHVFHAYAAYRPPFRREDTQLVEDKAGDVQEKEKENKDEARETAPIVLDSEGRFPHVPPQSHGEVLREVDFLFSRITERDPESSRNSHNPFHRVQLSTKLLNAYLSVYHAHASLEDTQALWKTLFAQHGVAKNAHTYTEALERCSYRSKKREREVAVKFAKEIWLEWRQIERQWLEDPNGLAVQGVNARMVERMHSAMIRVITSVGALDDALLHLAAFVQVYPPTNIREAPPLSPLRSTRTTLDAPRPLVRLTSAIDVPDDTVPPLLTFSDLELLHHRLVAAFDREGVNYVKWVCKAYEGSLRARRENVMKGTRDSNVNVNSQSAGS